MPARATTSPPPRRRRNAADSRQRILAAAATEFALRGFAAAGVDRIAARARLNKAMIYYHFQSKQNLYRSVLADIFGAMGAHLQSIAASPEPPAAKLDRFVQIFVDEGTRAPHFAPIILREIAEGGRRLDEETYTLMVRIVRAMTGIVTEGRAAGQFNDVDPILLYLTTVWPIMVYLATEPIRHTMARVAKIDIARFEPDRFVRHLQALNRNTLSIRTGTTRSTAHAS